MAMRQTPLTCSGHTRPVVDLAFSGITPYGYFLISACKGGSVGATLNKDATKAATGAADFTAKVWDAVTGDELITLAHKHIVKSVDFTQDSNNLLTGGQDKLLRIYDLSKPEAGTYGYYMVRPVVWCLVSVTLCLSGSAPCRRQLINTHISRPEHPAVRPLLDLCDSAGGLLRAAVVVVPPDPEQIGGHTSAIKKALWYNDDRQIISAADDKTLTLVPDRHLSIDVYQQLILALDRHHSKDVYHQLTLAPDRHLSIDGYQQLTLAPDHNHSIDVYHQLTLVPSQHLSIDVYQQLTLAPDRQLSLDVYQQLTLAPDHNHSIDVYQQLTLAPDRHLYIMFTTS
ncbi:unnamed protein product [Ranitomeya imitator]|uniref:Serine-threonine kinase receptor-associated protein n=1 Tax=Ranitomeya imitator TaxID=111125 RepID=A0ABN9LP26_9NEOB|nr:unnamed protein product [Ranitomeya imitator]